MGCTACRSDANGVPKGCNSNGNCLTGGCNRLNTYDWFSMLRISNPESFDFVEVSFKQGARKQFYRCAPYLQVITGDQVVVDVGNGHDIGRISLSGELVRLQMRKKRQNPDKVIHKVIRKAHQRDLEKLMEGRSLERDALRRARVIARTLGLDMKIGDVEYRGDKRKATFYYTADGRVDFRELVRNYAREFRVKIEMRQIGARQESARIGGVGSCGRELCCSTWLTDFKSVNTSAARYQNLSINQAKLSGQCGRLKCCLNYELDTYLDALKEFPKNVDEIYTQKGKAVLIKTDIFKKLMFYAYETERGRSNITPIPVERVRDITEMNRAGKKPKDLIDERVALEAATVEIDFDSVNDVIELPPEKKRKKRRSSRKRRGRSGKRRKGGSSQKQRSSNSKKSHNQNKKS